MVKFLKSTVFISFAVTVAVIFGGLFGLGSLLNQQWIEEKDTVSCFEDFEHEIHTTVGLVHLEESVNCFDWDSVALGYSTEYRKKIDLNYKIFRLEPNGQLPPFDFEERCKDWSYLYFYVNGLIVENAIAIPNKNIEGRITWRGYVIEQTAITH
jgi:hypothetical protein